MTEIMLHHKSVARQNSRKLIYTFASFAVICRIKSQAIALDVFMSEDVLNKELVLNWRCFFSHV